MCTVVINTRLDTCTNGKYLRREKRPENSLPQEKRRHPCVTGVKVMLPVIGKNYLSQSSEGHKLRRHITQLIVPVDKKEGQMSDSFENFKKLV